MNVLASPLDNLSVYGGLGLGGKADSVKSNSMPVNVGARYLYDVTTSIAVGPFVDYISESKFDGGMKSSALSYGVSGAYTHQSGLYGIASIGLNDVDSNLDGGIKNGMTIIGTLGYMITPKIAVEGAYRNTSFKDNTSDKLDYSLFSLGAAYHF